MSVFFNSLTYNQIRIIENLSGDFKYGKADMNKGDIRKLRRAGVIAGRELKLTSRAPIIFREGNFSICDRQQVLGRLKRDEQDTNNI